MTSFHRYSQLYNSLYSEKDYATEAKFVMQRMAHITGYGKQLLDLGCGTGLHAQTFAKFGYEVTGVDLSAEMLDEARSLECRSIDFVQEDIRRLNLPKRFDAAVALFHVMSYISTNVDLETAFRVVRNHLKSEALFFFDYWNGPGVLTDPPTTRVKSVENIETKIIRVATPRTDVNSNIVDVQYDLMVVDKHSKHVEEFSEVHRMRYFFQPELEGLLVRNGFEVIGFSEWLSEKSCDVKSWNACVLARAC